MINYNCFMMEKIVFKIIIDPDTRVFIIEWGMSLYLQKVEIYREKNSFNIARYNNFTISCYF